MDQRPSNPSDDAWQPHEPGRPAGDVPAQPGHTPDAGAHGTPEQGWRGVSWQGAPGQGLPGEGSPDQVGYGPVGYAQDEAVQGPAPTGPGRSRRLLAGAALATGLAVGGAGVAAAVTSDDDALPGGSERAGSQNGFFPGARGFDDTAEGQQSQPGQPDQEGQEGQAGPRGFGHHGRGGPGGFGGLGGPRGALHGELVVPQEDGTGTRTITVQNGSVTAVSSTRLTVKSTDGFDATYVVSSSTRLAAGAQSISAVKVGHQVTVVATKSGSTLTAIRIGDVTLRQQYRDDRRDDDDSPAPSPSATPSTSGASA